MINEAFLFALEAHKAQKRKGGEPYIVHPFEVAMELAKNGADDDLICAGLLHDVIEDAGVTKEELTEKFSSNICELVLSDSEDKSLTWEERKQNTLDYTAKDSDRRHKMLVCADKLANIKSMSKEYEAKGEELWSLFKRGKDKQEWLFRSFVEVLKPIDDLPMYQEFAERVNSFFDKK